MLRLDIEARLGEPPDSTYVARLTLTARASCRFEVRVALLETGRPGSERTGILLLMDRGVYGTTVHPVRKKYRPV